MRGRLAALVICIAAVAGCSSAADQQESPAVTTLPDAEATPDPRPTSPSPTVVPSPSTADDSASDPVPAVRSPLDARDADPCQLLTEEQKRQLGLVLDSERSQVQPSAVRCRWNVGDIDSVQATVGGDTSAPGLAGIYRQRGSVSLFEPGEIDGYPVVRAELGPPGDTECTLYIGVADDQLLGAAVTAPSRDRDPCESARRLAAYMISNLPPLR